ncbi:MAG TPA: TonB family protein [Vicinamibacterales bacterium]|nr:TonB family protein [Vicinamibacterales bacterium]
MTTIQAASRWMLALTSAAVLTAGAAHAQEPLTRVKAFYASAAYEEALSALSTLEPDLAPIEAVEAAAYRVFCLLALGRTDEARVAVESLVRRDPFYQPTDGQASPRVRAFFEDVRRPMLADLALQTYTAARAAFDRQELPAAADGFARVLRLLDDIGDAGGGATELRLLVSGFRDLARLEIAREAAAEAAPAVVETPPVDPPATGATAAAAPPASDVPAPGPEPVRIFADGDPGVIRPTVVSRAMPPWVPPAMFDRHRTYEGIVEVVVDEQGRVESAAIRETVHALYDPQLLRVAKGWKFTPATRDGGPVKYRYRIAVRVGGGA